MKSRPALDRCYPHLRNFFHLQLRIEDADPAIVLQELSQLAKNSGNRRITEEAAKRAEEILVDVADLANKLPNMTSRIQQICSGAVFPATFPGQGLKFSKLTSIYVPDPGRELAKALEKRVPLLKLSDTVLWKIGHLFDTALQHHVKHLSSAVTKEIKASGRQRYLPDMSQRYAEKSIYIERLVRAVSDATSGKEVVDVAQLLRLRKVHISTVESIMVSISIEGKLESNSVRVHIEDSDQGMMFLINKRLLPSPDTWDSGISGELATLLKIRPSELFCILTMPIHALEELYFKPRGIPKYELAKEEVSSITRSTTAPTLKTEFPDSHSLINQTLPLIHPTVTLQPALTPSIIAPSEIEIPKDRWTQQWLDSQAPPVLSALRQNVTLGQPTIDPILLSGSNISTAPSEVILSASQDNSTSHSTQYLRLSAQAPYPVDHKPSSSLRPDAPSFALPISQTASSELSQDVGIAGTHSGAPLERSQDTESSYNLNASRSILETELSDMSISETDTSISSTRSPRLRSRLEEWRSKRADEDLSTIASPVLVSNSQLRTPSPQSMMTPDTKSATDDDSYPTPEPRTPQTYADDIADQNNSSNLYIKSEPISPDRNLPKFEQQRLYAAEFSSNMSNLGQLGLQLYESPRKDAKLSYSDVSWDAKTSAQFLPISHPPSLTPIDHGHHPSQPKNALVEASENTPMSRTHNLTDELTIKGIQFVGS
jgi:hypothetical protein